MGYLLIFVEDMDSFAVPATMILRGGPCLKSASTALTVCSVRLVNSRLMQFRTRQACNLVALPRQASTISAYSVSVKSSLAASSVSKT